VVQTDEETLKLLRELAVAQQFSLVESSEPLRSWQGKVEDPPDQQHTEEILLDTTPFAVAKFRVNPAFDSRKKTFSTKSRCP